jgi:hypothetical protein
MSRSSDLHFRAAAAKLAAIGLAAIVALSGLWLAFGNQKTDFEALGVGGDSRRIWLPGIHCRDPRDALLCYQGAAERAAARRVLIIGNSQLHVVTSWRGGETTTPVQLHNRLIGESIDVVTLSLPGLNHQEQMVMVEAAMTRMAVDAVVLPSVYPLMGDRGLRDSVMDEMARPEVRSALSHSPQGKAMLALYDSGDRRRMASGTPEDPTIGATRQERTEMVLENWLDEHSGLWRTRPEARGQFLLAMRELRNALLRIDAGSLTGAAVKGRGVRNMIADTGEGGGPPVLIDPGAYAMNIQHLDALLARLRAKGVPALVYVAPFPPRGYARVERSAFAAYSQTIADLAKRHGAEFLDLEGIVVDRAWTTRVVEGTVVYDMMHFNGEGHRALTEHLAPAIRKALEAKR